jgi:hypothetical protein
VAQTSFFDVCNMQRPRCSDIPGTPRQQNFHEGYRFNHAALAGAQRRVGPQILAPVAPARDERARRLAVAIEPVGCMLVRSQDGKVETLDYRELHNMVIVLT